MISFDYSSQTVVLVNTGAKINYEGKSFIVSDTGGVEIKNHFFTTEENWEKLVKKYENIDAMVLVSAEEFALVKDYIIWNVQSKKWFKNKTGQLTSKLDKAYIFSRKQALDICDIEFWEKNKIKNIPILLRDIFNIL